MLGGRDSRSSAAAPRRFGKDSLSGADRERHGQLGNDGAPYAVLEVIHGHRPDLLETLILILWIL